MTVKEIVYTVARELGVYDEVMKYVEGVTTDGEVVAEMLLDCFNIVENELALDYFPMYAEEKMLAVNEKLLYKDFSKSPVRIVKVCNQDGEEIAYGIYADHLKVPSGLLTVTYAYTPNKKKMNEPLELGLEVSERLIIYGVLSQYCLAMGFCEQAAIWDKKFKEAIECKYRMGKGGQIASRRWV